MADYDPSAFPTSYKDPAYDAADQAASSAIGIPSAWLTNIRTKGERSNADQVSSASAKTPYQIVPATRQAIIDQTGVDPYLNPQMAAYGAAYLLKQNLGRYGGNAVLATAAYHGGNDQSQWGPKTMAYTKRVTGASPNNADATPSFGNPSSAYQVQPLPNIGAAPGSLPDSAPQSSFSPSSSNPYAVAPLPNIGSAPGALDSGSNGPSPLARIYDAYKSGQMSPEDKAAFEQDVNSGRIVLPSGMGVNPPAPQAPVAPQQLVSAFNSGLMSPEDVAQLQKDVQSGAITLPPGANLTGPPPATPGREGGIAARGYVQGLSDAAGGLVDRAKGLIDAPTRMVNAIAQGPVLPAIDQALGTHLAGSAPIPTQQTGVGATQIGEAIPSVGETATAVMDRNGMPTAQTPREKVLQSAAQGAGALTVPVPGMALKAIPGMIAAGAAGGTVGEAVHQATGSPMLGMAVNLLTTALSPAAASKVMAALAKELPQAAAAGAERIEPTMAAAQEGGSPTGTSAAESVPATAQPSASAAPAGSSAPANLATTLNPGAPQVPNPAIEALQAEREQLIQTAANAPQKGDTSVQDQIASLEGKSFDSVADRTKMLQQQQGMKFGDARALAQKQLSGEMSAYQDQMVRLQAAHAQQAEGSRALQRVQEIDQQLASMPRTVPAQQNPMAAAARGAMEAPAPAAAAQAPEAAASAAPEATAAMTPPAAAEESAARAESPVNPAASPLTSASHEFLPADQLAAQTRIAVGAGRAPFGIGKQTAQQTLAAQMAPDAERLAAAERLGIADNLQPDHLTTNQAAIELAQAIKSTPGSLARAEEMQGLQQVAQRGQKIVEDAGGMSDLSQLSASVKNDLMNTQQQLDQKAEGLYDDLRKSVPAKMDVDPSPVLDFIAQRADELGGAKNLSPVERMIQSKLTPAKVPMMVGGQEIDPATLGLKPQVKNPTYALLDDVRKNVGAGLRNQGPFKDADTGLLKALYGRISEAQRGALSTVPGALEKFDTARATVQMRKSIEDDLTSLYGKQLGDSLVGKLGTAMAALPKGDVSKFVDIIKAVPSGMRQQVTSSGLAYAFGKATKNGDLNFKTFADWWDGLMKNSQAANAVLANLPAESRQQLADLAKVSRGISNATRENITTGRIMAAREELNAHADGLVSKVMNTARQAAVGHIGTAAAAGAASVAGPIGAGLSHAVISALSKGKPDVMKAADELIVSPEFQQLAKSGAAPAPQVVKAAANSSTFRRFYDLARSAMGANDPASRERWLLGIVNAAEPAANSNTNR
nr:transglycosylase SLT domain-containing protein [Paraburkholderia sp.]